MMSMTRLKVIKIREGGIIRKVTTEIKIRKIL